MKGWGNVRFNNWTEYIIFRRNLNSEELFAEVRDVVREEYESGPQQHMENFLKVVRESDLMWSGNLEFIDLTNIQKSIWNKEVLCMSAGVEKKHNRDDSFLESE